MIITLSRDWRMNVSNLSGYVAAGSNAQNGLSVLGIKNVLLGAAGKYGWTNTAGAAAAAPTSWAVYYSSNGTAPGTGVAGDGVDRWVTASDILWGNVAGANSWMVLYNARAGLYWLLSCENSASDSNTLDMWVSTTAFAGGTSTARPTAANEQNMLVSTLWGAGGSFPIRYHVQMSTDGLATRVFTTRAMSLAGVWLIEPLGDPIGNLQANLLATAWGAAPINFNQSLSQVQQPLARQVGGPTISGVLSMDGSRYVAGVHNSAALTDRMFWNDLTGQNSLFAINVWGIGYPTRGRLGALVDLWGSNDLIASGRSWPGNGDRQLMALGPLVVPWNQSIAETY